MMKRFLPYSLFSKTLGLIHRPRPADALFSSSSYSTAAAATPPEPRSMTHYLVTTCGYSVGRAAKTSAELDGITSLRQLVSVVGFFKSHGVDAAQMRKLLSCNPRWFSLDPEKSLVPKFQALQDLGFSGSDIVRIFGSSHINSSISVETVEAKIQFWQGILGSKDFMLVFRKRQWILGSSIMKTIKPNIDLLQECGFTDQMLTKIVIYNPRIIRQRTEDLKALISRAESLGVDRSSGMFRWTLWVLCTLSRRKFNAQLELFKGLGWSEDEFLVAFRKAPAFVTGPSQCLQKKFEFLVKEFGCDPSYIKSHPAILTLSLEKRIIPRCKILTALKSRGLCCGDHKLTSVLRYSEEKFLNKYIFCHKEKFPELLGLYEPSPK